MSAWYVRRTTIAALLLLAAWSSQASAATVDGSVRYFSAGRPMPQVPIRVIGPAGTIVTTAADGTYSAGELAAGVWTISLQPAAAARPDLEIDDARRMLLAAIGGVQLSATEQLACDVSGNGTVTAFDAALTLRYLLGAAETLPAWQRCGSPFLHLPAPTGDGNVFPSPPVLSPTECRSGFVAAVLDEESTVAADFTSVAIGDCDGSWVPVAPPPTATPVATLTPSRTTTSLPSPTTTSTPTRTTTRTPTRTATATPTSTATSSPSPTPTTTSSATPTNSPTPTPAPAGTATAPPDPAACSASAVWNLAAPTTLHTHQNGEVWLSEAVPTDTGWGIFWLRREPDSLNLARLYYAHVGFDGALQVPPIHVRDISFLQWRRRYYLAAWHEDHFGLLIADGSTLRYFNLSKAGTLSGQRTVGPQLFNSALYGQQSDGDMVSYPGGFGVIIEGDCSGHLCSYGFRLGPDGTPTSSVFNLVDFDYTHQFDPRIAFDGSGFALLSIKDGSISTAGVVTKYMTTTGSPGSRARVVPTKEYFWDEWPDVAWNGDHFAAIWSENTGRDHATPWRVRFASFRRNSSGSTTIGENILEVLPGVFRVRHWTTQLHSLGATWLGQYTRFVDGPDFAAVYRWLNDDGEVLGTFEPFLLNTDALGSSVHPAPEAQGRIAIVRGSQQDSEIRILFQLLDRPTCPN